jgi:hypothetical protein
MRHFHGSPSKGASIPPWPFVVFIGQRKPVRRHMQVPDDEPPGLVTYAAALHYGVLKVNSSKKTGVFHFVCGRVKKMDTIVS